MGLFSRHPDVPNGTAHHRHRGDAAGPYGARPGFGEWLKGTGLDILTMAALGAIGLGVSDGTPTITAANRLRNKNSRSTKHHLRLPAPFP
jgi:hypothetical protein